MNTNKKIIAKIFIIIAIPLVVTGLFFWLYPFYNVFMNSSNTQTSIYSCEFNWKGGTTSYVTQQDCNNEDRLHLLSIPLLGGGFLLYFIAGYVCPELFSKRKKVF